MMAGDSVCSICSRAVRAGGYSRGGDAARNAPRYDGALFRAFGGKILTHSIDDAQAFARISEYLRRKTVVQNFRNGYGHDFNFLFLTF
jgi:hypothetical protein